MNKVVLLGNLVKDPELRIIDNGERCYTKVVIAIDRNFRTLSGEKEADFIPVIFWGKKAEILCKYMTKGRAISVSGRLRTCSYEDKDGNKKYKIEVQAEEFRFIGDKKEKGAVSD